MLYRKCNLEFDINLCASISENLNNRLKMTCSLFELAKLMNEHGPGDILLLENVTFTFIIKIHEICMIAFRFRKGVQFG
ncbi:hypothetical protein Syun_025595 [Stephania yunnanensis]|uniref:Uncharacterized protein n=1 Tax=Stephania yunnanensis TaxID=152371 RepID=A0AAP0HWB6_9MAGN